MARGYEVDCCVAGGGPAGMMAGILFARAGCRTLVLEKHPDFLRDFRGDTVHPSTLELMHELGLLEAFLKRPHQCLAHMRADFAGERLELADFSDLKATCRFIAFMPQWHFLDFLLGAARSLPTFAIEMPAEVTRLIEENGRVIGVVADTPEGPLEVRARLIIGADGRQSTVRARAGLKATTIGAPIDVLWFRLPRIDGAPAESLFNAGPGQIVVTIDRGTYYQCAFVIAKGGADAVKARGIEAFRKAVVTAAPHLAGPIEALGEFDEVKLLTVAIDRLERWWRPGLLMIGDSAHAMSPVGGVGINLAVQDAVCAANLLADPLHAGALADEALEGVQRRRLWPVRATQFLQVQVQNRILTPIIAGKDSAPRPPLLFRVASRSSWLKHRFASLIGLGVLPEHIHSPQQFPLTAGDG